MQPTAPLRLQTARLVLRELRLDDWTFARALDTDPEIVRYQTNDVLDEAGTKQYLERSINAAAERPRTTFDLAITLPADDRYLGRAGFKIERPEHREAQVWFQLRRDQWGHGYASEALRAVLALAFDHARVHRVYGDCDPRNLASARVMEKAGMIREAHLRENWWLKGEWCGSFIYAVLEDEWRASRSTSEINTAPRMKHPPTSSADVGTPSPTTSAKSNVKTGSSE